MPNKNYNNGRKKEYAIINHAKKAGSHIIAFRSAGSHSIVDVCIIDPHQKRITFVQSKLNKYGLTKKEEADFKALSGIYAVEFKLISRGELS